MGQRHSSQFTPKEKPCTVFKSEVLRIPALFYHRDQKILLAFAEKRCSADDAHSVALVMRRGVVIWDDTAHTVTDIEWSDSTELITKHELQDYRPMNPCPVYDKMNNKLFLFFIKVEDSYSEQWQIKYNWNKARLCYMTTIDAGQTWSDVTDLTDALEDIKSWSTFAVGPGHGLQTDDGRMIVPAYAYTPCCPWPFSLCCSCCNLCCSAPYALSLYSDDFGKSWKCGKMLERQSLECQMEEIIDDNNKSSIYCNARTQRCCRVEAVSQNKGEEFSLKCSKLVETRGGCHGSLVSSPDLDEEGDQKPKWLLFSHPSNRKDRTNLGIYLNKTPEDPKAWSDPWIINHGPSGYSDLVYLDHGWFACLVECGTKTYTEQINLLFFSYNKNKAQK